jgi:zinc-binding alcohol dehydrogenase family protein
MRAVAYTKALPTSDERCFVDIELEKPEPAGFDLLVEIQAVSVNPVDVKRRARDDPAGVPRVLGYDASGIVVAMGERATRFRPGDAVYYAGALQRPGSNGQFQLVDERLVGHKPARLSFAEAAALPLTALTAWELMFERIGLGRHPTPDKRVLLLVGGAGGVGSIAIQLARRLTGLTVLATASREETRGWCLDMGAHHVIDHSQLMTAQLHTLGLRSADVILGLNASDRHLSEIADMIAPFGHFGIIDDAKGADFGRFKSKSASIHWEFMFTRSSFSTPDMRRQGEILDEISDLVDAGRLRSTLSEIVGPIDAAHLREAHRRLEGGRAYGKIVLANAAGSSGHFV